MTYDVRRARQAYLWVGVIIPAVVTMLTTIVIAVWLPELPDPAATHWSGGGGPDGFGPAWTYLAMGAGIPVGMIILFGALALFAHRLPTGRGVPHAVGQNADEPQWSSTARFLGAMMLGMSAMMSLTMLVSVGTQRGLADAADAPDITLWVVVGFAVMAVVGVIGWFAQPAVAPTPIAVDDVEPLGLRTGERASWFQNTSIALGGRIVLGLLTLAVLVMTVLIIAQIPFAQWDVGPWVLVGTSVLMIVVLALTFSFDVRADADGLTVRSRAGWPKTRIRLADMAKVEVVHVEPFGQFGGWGWRIGLDGRRGFVTRRGPALQITRRNGRVFVVTVDDADEGAAVLNGLRADEASRTAPKGR